MAINWDALLPACKVFTEQGKFEVDDMTSLDDEDRQKPRDYDMAVTIRMGPMRCYMPADAAIELAEALIQHAHHFIAFSLEKKLEEVA